LAIRQLVQTQRLLLRTPLGHRNDGIRPASSSASFADVTVVSGMNGERGGGETRLSKPAVHFAGDFSLGPGPDQQGTHLFPSQYHPGPQP
jgi:hypothetical protein